MNYYIVGIGFILAVSLILYFVLRGKGDIDDLTQQSLNDRYYYQIDVEKLPVQNGIEYLKVTGRSREAAAVSVAFLGGQTIECSAAGTTATLDLPHSLIDEIVAQTDGIHKYERFTDRIRYTQFFSNNWRVVNSATQLSVTGTSTGPKILKLDNEVIGADVGGIAIKSQNGLYQFRIYRNGQLAIVKKVTMDFTDEDISTDGTKATHTFEANAMSGGRPDYKFKYGDVNYLTKSTRSLSGSFTTDRSITNVWQLVWAPQVHDAYDFDFSFNGDELSIPALFRKGRGEPDANVQTLEGNDDSGGKPYPTVFTISNNGIPQYGKKDIPYWVPDDGLANGAGTYPHVTINRTTKMTAFPTYYNPQLGANNYQYVRDWYIDPPTNHLNIWEFTAFGQTNVPSTDKYKVYMIDGDVNTQIPPDIYNPWHHVGHQLVYSGNSGESIITGATSSLGPGQYMTPEWSWLIDGSASYTYNDATADYPEYVRRRWMFRIYVYGFETMWYWENGPTATNPIGYYPQTLTCKGVGHPFMGSNVTSLTLDESHTKQCALAINLNGYASLYHTSPGTWDTGAFQRANGSHSFEVITTATEGTPYYNMSDTTVPKRSWIDLIDGKPWMRRIAGRHATKKDAYDQIIYVPVGTEETIANWWSKPMGVYDHGTSQPGIDSSYANHLGKNHAFALTGNIQISHPTVTLQSVREGYADDNGDYSVQGTSLWRNWRHYTSTYYNNEEYIAPGATGQGGPPLDCVLHSAHSMDYPIWRLIYIPEIGDISQ